MRHDVGMASGFLSDEIQLEAVERSNGLALVYAVDRLPSARIEIPVPTRSRRAVDLILAATAIYLGSLTLARRVTLLHPLGRPMLDELLPIAEMLYDIRRWRESLPLEGPPQLRSLQGFRALPETYSLDDEEAVLLWSGGKDSTLALLTLRANGYRVHPLHATVNDGVADRELAAVSGLARSLAVEELRCLAISHPDFRSLSGRYASSWDQFPLSNRVPFGRDLLLYAVAVPFALEARASVLAFGHEHECRHAEVLYGGRRIPRNDVESAGATTLLESAMREHVHPDLSILLPVANLSELRILRDMFTEHPQLMAQTAFCFWGGNCGRCGKCLRYFLAQRLYCPGLLSFHANPLRPGVCPELEQVLRDPTTLFHDEIVVLLSRIAQRGDIRAGETVLERFAADALPEIEPSLDRREAELLAEYGDPQVPASFHAISALADLPDEVMAGASPGGRRGGGG